jgi:hypothetical protein
VNSRIEKPEPGVANSIVRGFTQIIDPSHLAFPTDAAKKDAAK